MGEGGNPPFLQQFYLFKLMFTEDPAVVGLSLNPSGVKDLVWRTHLTVPSGRWRVHGCPVSLISSSLKNVRLSPSAPTVTTVVFCVFQWQLVWSGCIEGDVCRGPGLEMRCCTLYIVHPHPCTLHTVHPVCSAPLNSAPCIQPSPELCTVYTAYSWTVHYVRSVLFNPVSSIILNSSFCTQRTSKRCTLYMVHS